MAERLLLQQNILLTKLVDGLIGSTKNIQKGTLSLNNITKKPLIDPKIFSGLPTFSKSITAAFETFPNELKRILEDKISPAGDIEPPLSSLEVGIQQGVEAIVKSIMVVASLLKESFSGTLSEGERVEFTHLTDSLLNYQESMKEAMTNFEMEGFSGAMVGALGIESPQEESARLEADRLKKSKTTFANIPRLDELPRTIRDQLNVDSGADKDAPDLQKKYGAWGKKEGSNIIPPREISVGSMFGGLIDAGKFIGKGFKNTLKPLKKMGKGIKSNISAMGIQAQMLSVVTDPIAAFIQGALAPFSMLGDVMGGLGEKLGMVFVPLIIKVSEILMKLMPFIDFLVKLFTPLIDVIIQLLDQLQPLIDMIMEMMMAQLQPMMDYLMAFMPILTELMPFIVMLLGFIMQFQTIFSRLISSLLPHITAGLTLFLTPLTSLMDLFQGNISIEEFGKIVHDMIGELFSLIARAFIDLGKEIPALLYEWVKDMFSVDEWF